MRREKELQHVEKRKQSQGPFWGSEPLPIIPRDHVEFDSHDRRAEFHGFLLISAPPPSHGVEFGNGSAGNEERAVPFFPQLPWS
jgi:hypothetical protein